MSATITTTDPADRIAGETLITLKDVAARYRSARGDKPLHVGSVRRWRLRGVDGVLLGTVLIGGTRYTSEEELARFRRAVAQARARRTRRVRLPLGPSPAKARREHERAKARNDARRKPR